MSRIPGRIRLAFTDDESDALQQTHVVVRQRVFWVMLLGAFLALLCLPAHRGVFLDQAYGVVTRRPAEWARVSTALSGMSRPRLEKVLSAHPDNRELLLGSVLLGEWRNSPDAAAEAAREAIDLDSPRLRYLQDVTERYPNDPILLATYLRYCTLKAVQIQRPENDPKSTFKPIGPAVLQRFEAGCLRGATLDPDNGYFPTLLAVVRYAAGQDEGALAALHQASLATRWADYSEAEMAGGQALLIAAYGDRGPLVHAGPAAGVLLPHLAQIRSVARVAVFQADRRLTQGELERGHAIHADVVRLGRLMRENARTLIGRLVGGAVEAIGLRIRSEPGTHTGSVAAQKVAQEAERHAYARQVAREAPAYAAEIERANREQDLFVVKRAKLSEAFGYAAWDNLLRQLVGQELLGLSLAANLGVGLLLWGAAALLCGLPWRRDADGPTLLAWLWRRAHPLIRVPLFVGFGLAATLALNGALQGDPVSGLALPLVMLPLLLSVGLGPTPRPIGVGSLLLIALGALGSTAALTFPWAMSELQAGWWKDVIVSTALNGEGGTAAEIRNLAFAYWLPSGGLIAVALPAVTVCFAMLRRWSLPSTVERLRLVAKGLAGVLAISYLAYLLIVVPTNQQAGRSWDRLIELESQGVPF